MLILHVRKKLLAAGLAALGVGLSASWTLAQSPLPPVPPIAGFEPPSVSAPATPQQPSGFGRLKSLLPGRSNSTSPYGATPSASPLPIGNPSEPPIAEQIGVPKEAPTAPVYPTAPPVYATAPAVPTVPPVPTAPAMPPLAQPLPTGSSAGQYAAPMLTAPANVPAPAVVSQPIPGGCGCGQGKAPQAAQYGNVQPEPAPRRGFFSRLFGR